MDAKTEISIGDLLNAEPTLQRLAAMPVNVRVAYRVARLQSVVAKETKQYEALRVGLIKGEYGAEREVNDAEKERGMSGTVFEVKPERLVDFQSKVTELQSVVVTIDKWLLDLEMLSEVKLTASDIASLGSLISE